MITVLFQVREPDVHPDILGWVMPPVGDEDFGAVFLTDVDLKLLPWFSDLTQYGARTWNTPERDGWAPLPKSGNLAFLIVTTPMPDHVPEALIDEDRRRA